MNFFDPEFQFKDAESAIKDKLTRFIIWVESFKIHDNISFRVKENRMWWWNIAFLYSNSKADAVKESHVD